MVQKGFIIGQWEKILVTAMAFVDHLKQSLQCLANLAVMVKRQIPNDSHYFNFTVLGPFNLFSYFFHILFVLLMVCPVSTIPCIRSKKQSCFKYVYNACTSEKLSSNILEDK